MENAGLERPRVFHFADDLVQKAAFADSHDLHQQGSSAIDRAADDAITFLLPDRDRLAGYEGLIDRRVSAQDFAIHGNAFAGTDAHAVAGPDILDRQIKLLALAFHARGFRLKVEEALHGLRTARFDDQREPFREDVIGRDHHRDGEERRRRIAGRRKGEADHAAGDAGERAGLKQYMLVQNPATQRLRRHDEDVTPDPAYEIGRAHV